MRVSGSATPRDRLLTNTEVLAAYPPPTAPLHIVADPQTLAHPRTLARHSGQAPPQLAATGKAARWRASVTSC